MCSTKCASPRWSSSSSTGRERPPPRQVRRVPRIVIRTYYGSGGAPMHPAGVIWQPQRGVLACSSPARERLRPADRHGGSRSAGRARSPCLPSVPRPRTAGRETRAVRRDGIGVALAAAVPMIQRREVNDLARAARSNRPPLARSSPRTASRRRQSGRRLCLDFPPDQSRGRTALLSPRQRGQSLPLLEIWAGRCRLETDARRPRCGCPGVGRIGDPVAVRRDLRVGLVERRRRERLGLLVIEG